MKQILIIDDDLYIGNMLEEVLRKENYQVLRAYSGTEAILLLPSVKPDLILLDLMLPGLSGEELLPRIKDFPVIVLSAKVDVDSKVKLLLEGAVDYVTKPFETKELLARITVALRKNNSPVGNILSFADLHLDTETHMVFFSPKKDSRISSEEIRLTRTESAILKILMLNPSQVITKSLLLERISEDTPDCTDNSLKTHMSNLRKKLRKIGGREYIEAIWGIGFRLIQE
ncbi:response regulator transcription factor [Lachnospiraceae bacterium 38-10]